MRDGNTLTSSICCYGCGAGFVVDVMVSTLSLFRFLGHDKIKVSLTSDSDQ